MREWEIVGTGEVKEVWPRVEPWLLAACGKSFDKHSPGDFLSLILEEKAQLWVGRLHGKIEAAAITDILQFPNKRYARVSVGMGENPHDIKEFIDDFEQWAKENGCQGVQSEMRPGFKTPFHFAGWKQTHILMEKEI